MSDSKLSSRMSDINAITKLRKNATAIQFTIWKQGLGDFADLNNLVSARMFGVGGGLDPMDPRNPKFVLGMGRDESDGRIVKELMLPMVMDSQKDFTGGISGHTGLQKEPFAVKGGKLVYDDGPGPLSRSRARAAHLRSEFAKQESKASKARDVLAKAQLRVEEADESEAAAQAAEGSEAAPQSTEEATEEPFTQPEGGSRRRSGGRPSAAQSRQGLLSKVADASNALIILEEQLESLTDEIADLDNLLLEQDRTLYGWYPGDPMAEPQHLVGSESERVLVSAHLASFKSQCATMAAVIEATLTEELKSALRGIPIYARAKEYTRVDVMIMSIVTMVGNSSYANSEPNPMNMAIIEGLEKLSVMRQGSKELNSFIDEFTVCVDRLKERGWDPLNPVNDVKLGLFLIRACSNTANQRARDDATDAHQFQHPTCTKAWAEDKLRNWADRAKGVAHARDFQGGSQRAQINAAAATATPKNKNKTKKDKGAKPSGDRNQGSSNSSGKHFNKRCDICGPADHYTFDCSVASDSYKADARKQWEATKAERSRVSK